MCGKNSGYGFLGEQSAVLKTKIWKCPTACANKPTESRQNYNQNLLLHATLLTYKVQVGSLAHCSYVNIFYALPDP